MSNTVIIIGASAAGISCATTYARLNPTHHVICMTDQAEIPYNTCLLVDYLAGTKNYEQLALWRPSTAFTLLRNTRVIAINPDEKRVTLHTGEHRAYDKLFLGMGSLPTVPPAIEELYARKISGLFTFHTMHDTHVIKEYIAQYNPRNVLVIGAGLTGLECADALHARKLAMHVVEQRGQILSNHLDEKSACRVQEHMQQVGIKFYLNETVAQIVHQNNTVQGIIFQSGAILDVEMIVCATGTRAHNALAREAGISIEQDRVLVDQNLRTSACDIYAGGDLVMVRDGAQSVRSCTWPEAINQGIIAAHTMSGHMRTYPIRQPIINTMLCGLKIKITTS